MTLDALVAKVTSLASGLDGSPQSVHAVLTGGEPMIVPELPKLCEALHRMGMHITIETAGTRYLDLHCDLMSVSPKLSNSTPHGLAGDSVIAAHERGRIVPDVLKKLNSEYACQFKFVVDTPDDCREVTELLERFPEIDRSRVMLMPEGIDTTTLEERALWLIPFCREHGMKYCPRRQIEWYGCQRGT